MTLDLVLDISDQFKSRFYKIYSMNPKILLMSLFVFAASAVRVAHEGDDP